MVSFCVQRSTYPGQETPNLKMVGSWESAGESITFFPVLILFLKHPFTGDFWTCNAE